MYKSVPFYMKHGILSRTKQHIEFENGNILTTDTSYIKNYNEDGSINIDQVIALDYGYFTHSSNEKLLNYITDITKTNSGKLILTTTGKSDNIQLNEIFYNSLRSDSDPRKNSFKGHAVQWWQVPNRGKEWLHDQLALLGEEQFRKEYEISLGVTKL